MMRLLILMIVIIHQVRHVFQEIVIMLLIQRMELTLTPSNQSNKSIPMPLNKLTPFSPIILVTEIDP